MVTTQNFVNNNQFIEEEYRGENVLDDRLIIRGKAESIFKSNLHAKG